MVNMNKQKDADFIRKIFAPAKSDIPDFSKKSGI
jgi:hypothetical protein